MPPQYFEPLYVPPEETATLAEPVFDPVARGGLARVQPQAIQAIQPQAQIARQPVAPQRRTEMDYWGQPVVGGMPRDLFVALTGGAAQAIAPRTPMGRLGGGLARMAGDVYGRRMRREEEEPERALQRRISEAQLRQLERPEMVEYKEIDPETGREITRRVRPEEVPTERVTGLPTIKREKGIKQIGGKYYTGYYDETGKFTSQRELTKAEYQKQVTGIPEEKRVSEFEKQNYGMLKSQVIELEKIKNTPDPVTGKLPSGEAAANIQKKINENIAAMDKLQKSWRKSGLTIRDVIQPSIDERAFEPIIQQAIAAGIPKAQINEYIKRPNVTPEDLARQFNIGRGPEVAPRPTPQAPPIREEAPEVKAVPINAGLQRQERQAVPFRRAMTEAPTEAQRTAAMQELSDLANTFGLGAEDWRAVGRAAQRAGSWAWNRYQNAINTLMQSQRESRERLGGGPTTRERTIEDILQQITAPQR